MRRWSGWVVAALLVGWWGGPAPADDPALFVPNGADVEVWFRQCQRRVRSHDWVTAAALALRCTEQQPDAILQVPGATDRFGSVPDVLGAAIAQWPAAGLQAWRDAAEPAAAVLLAHGDLTAVIKRYPATMAAGVALARLADAALEAGDAGAAADLYDRLLARATLAIPDPWTRDPSAVVQRAATAFAAAGLPGRLERWAAAPLVTQASPALGRAVAAALARARQAAATDVTSEGWPTFGGGVARHGTGGTPVDLQTPHAWTEYLPTLPGMNDRRARRLEYLRETRHGLPRFDPGRLHRRYRPIEPVVAGGVVFAPSGMAVQAWELYTGRAVRDPFFDAITVEPTEAFDPSLIHTATWADGALFVQVGIANLESDVYSAWTIKEPIPQRQLVCLDARTGQRRWAVGAGARGAAGGRIDAASIVAPALVAGGTVYTVARLGRGGMGEYWAVALDAASGDVRWERRICDGGTELNMFGRPLREAVVSPLALHGGLITVVTNVGAVAALEARTGQIRWIVRYDVTHIPNSINFRPQKRVPMWRTAAPVVHGDVVLAAPADSAHLMALDRRTGAVRWMVAADEADGTSYYYLLGVARGQVIVSGNRVAALDVATGAVRWQAPAQPVDGGVEPAGRGALAGDRIYWPTPNHLRVLDLDGAVLGARTWSEIAPACVAGNITCVGGALIVSWVRDDQPGCTVLCDRAAVLAALESQARETPRDPAPLLTAVEVRLQADTDVSFARVTLKRAWERWRNLPPGEHRRRLRVRARSAEFRLGLKAAAEAGRRGRPAEALEALATALAAADETTDQVRVLLQIASHHEAQNDAAGARAAWRRVADEFGAVPFATASHPVPSPAGLVALLRMAEYVGTQPGGGAALVAVWQEILVRYGDTPMPRDAFGNDAPPLAGRWVRDRLGAYLARAGRAAYAPFDAEARALVERAGPDDAEAVLHTLLQQYPHAAVLPTAVLRLAGTLREAGRPAVAAEALQTWLREHPAPEHAAQANWLLAGCYEQQSMWAAARAVLERLRDTHGARRIVPTADAPPAPVRELVEQRLAGEQYAETRAAVREPLLAAPLARAYQLDLSASAVLIQPRGTVPAAGRGHVYVASEGTLTAHVARTGAVAWTASAGRTRVFDCLAGMESLLVTTVRQLSAIDPATGAVRWQRTIPVRSTPCFIGASRGLVVAAGTPPDNPQQTLVHAFEERTGQPLWQARIDGAVRPYPIAHAGTVAFWVAERNARTRSTHVRVLDLLSGAPRFAVPCGPTVLAGGTPPALLPNGDLAVVIDDAELRAIDPDTGTHRWSHPIGDTGVQGGLVVGPTQLLLRRIPGNGGDMTPVVSGVDWSNGARNWSLRLPDAQDRTLELAGADLLVPRLLEDGRLVCECYDARDGRTLRWRGDLGLTQAQCSKLLVARDHVVAVVNTPTGNRGRVEVSLIVFERRTGKLAQDPVSPGGEFDDVPLVVLADDGTVVLQAAGLLTGLAAPR